MLQTLQELLAGSQVSGISVPLKIPTCLILMRKGYRWSPTVPSRKAKRLKSRGQASDPQGRRCTVWRPRHPDLACTTPSSRRGPRSDPSRRRLGFPRVPPGHGGDAPRAGGWIPATRTQRSGPRRRPLRPRWARKRGTPSPRRPQKSGRHWGLGRRSGWPWGGSRSLSPLVCGQRALQVHPDRRERGEAAAI